MAQLVTQVPRAAVDTLDTLDVYLKLYVLLNGDDTIIQAETIPYIQCALYALQEYCHPWNVNVSKRNIVIFSRGKTRHDHNFTYEGSRVDVVDSFIYLGVELNYNGKSRREEINRLVRPERPSLT